MIQNKSYTFRVKCKVQPGDKVYVIGSCEELGGWNPQNLISLEPENPQDLYKIDQEIVWHGTVSIFLENLPVQYRYCVANVHKSESNGSEANYFSIKRWETNIQPRYISENDDLVIPVSNFGYITDQYKVDEGWLEQDNLVEVKLFNSNIYGKAVTFWKKKHKNKKFFIKMTPVQVSNSRDVAGENSLEESNTEAELNEFRMKSLSLSCDVTVSVMKENLSEYKAQGQFGILCSNDEFASFRVRVTDPHSLAYLMDYYLENGEETPKYVGCTYILASNLNDNAGVATLPITSDKHIPIGQLIVHYLVIQPLEQYKCSMEVSYARYWKDTWKGLEVGHRGAGNSFHSQTKNCANIRENTIASLKYASENGADMVEFDVQLSKDLIPVIYHDYHVILEMKNKKESQKTEIMEIPVKDLTLDQLQDLKLYHRTEKGGMSKFSDEELEDHQPFPTLLKTFNAVPISCGFNVELKWTMRYEDGTNQLNHPVELNRFIDRIITVVLENAGHRKIIFSSFHPDICSMIRLKQNRFPVIFLTQGIQASKTYDDTRARTIRDAVLFASSTNILGINVKTEDLLKDCNQIQLAFDHNLIAFCWGDQNSDKESIELLKKMGLHGIIYDKIDVYITKKDKRSVFLCEDKETCRCIPSKKRSVSRSPEHVVTASSYEPPLKILKVNDSCGQAMADEIKDSPTSFQGILAKEAVVS